MPVATADTPSPPTEHTLSEEVVIEICVRVPPGKGSAPVFSKDSSGTAQGALVSTQNQLDLAIEGEGFFQVGLPDGTLAYTRVGNFGVAADGSLVTAYGLRITPEIKIPAGAVNVCVGSDGTVSIQRAGALDASTVLGQLTLARLANPGWLTPKESGLFQENTRSGCPIIGTPGRDGLGLVRQGFRERHSDRAAAALIELVRDLGHEVNNNADGNGVRIKVKAGGKE
jgi:flagellar basal-body rod protein FlgG